MRDHFKGLLPVVCGLKSRNGELAQLARAPALHAGGQRFESVILHDPLDERRRMERRKTKDVCPCSLYPCSLLLNGKRSLTYWKKKHKRRQQ